MVSELKSKVPLDHVWKLAANKLQQRHPLLQVRVNIQTHEFERPVQVPEIPVQVVDSVNASDWQQIVRQELNTAFDLQTGPLFRITWLKPSFLITTCHHVICDGTAVYQLNKELLLLSKELLSPISNQETSTLLHERMTKPQNVSELIPKQYKANQWGVVWIIIKFFGKLAVQFLCNNWLLFPVRGVRYQKRRQDFFHHEFDEKTTLLLLEACKKNRGITLTNVVHACSSSAVVDVLTSYDSQGNRQSFKTTSDVIVPMCVTVDLRRNGCESIDAQAIRCYSSSIYTMIDVAPNDSTMQLACKSRSIMNDCLKDGQHLELQQVQFYTTKFIQIDTCFYVPIIYGNLGKWESINVSSDSFDAEAKGFFYSTPGSFNSIYLYTMTCNGKLNLSISFNASLMFPAIIDDFFKTMIQKLHNVVIEHENVSSS